MAKCVIERAARVEGKTIDLESRLSGEERFGEGRVTGGVRDEREGKKKKKVRDGAREEMNRKGKGKILNEGEGLKEMGASEWRTA